MIRGLATFSERFAAHAEKYVLIGGSACHEWLAREGLVFRATKDLDVVLVIEVLDADFVAALRKFVDGGGYERRERAPGQPELHRFSKPTGDDYPQMLELFSRRPGTIDLADDQRVVPMAVPDAAASLSAILLDDEYYNLIVTHRAMTAEGLPVATPTALIPLKARAWLDLTGRKAGAPEAIDQRDIDKHRTDVFRLAATLPGEPGPDLPASIKVDLKRFLDAFPINAPAWKGILAALEVTFGKRKLTSADLRTALIIFFRLEV
jgi:hypothetical protein